MVGWRTSRSRSTASRTGRTRRPWLPCPRSRCARAVRQRRRLLDATGWMKQPERASAVTPLESAGKLGDDSRAIAVLAVLLAHAGGD